MNNRQVIDFESSLVEVTVRCIKVGDLKFIFSEKMCLVVMIAEVLRDTWYDSVGLLDG